jgi:hypothetical protein
MRRLLTGCAGAFDRRHAWTGHLFQEPLQVRGEEPYLLELVRYLHLHPSGPGRRRLRRPGALSVDPFHANGPLRAPLSLRHTRNRRAEVLRDWAGGCAQVPETGSKRLRVWRRIKSATRVRIPRGIRPLVAGALSFLVSGEAWVA